MIDINQYSLTLSITEIYFISVLYIVEKLTFDWVKIISKMLTPRLLSKI